MENAASKLRARVLAPLPGVAVLALIVAMGATVTFVGAVGMDSTDVAVVVAQVETDPVPNEGDAADDSAIWVNPLDASASTILGTDKEGGIAVYDLSGRELQYLADGRLNNVDLRAGFSLGGETVTLVTASERELNGITIYTIDPATGLLSDVAAPTITTDIEVYGSCMYRDAEGSIYHFVNSKSGEVQQWRLFDNGSGRVDAELVRSFDVGSQLEGCVADDEFGRLYIGEENVGIWEYSAGPDAGDDRSLVARVGDEGPLVAEVEGLTIAYGQNGSGYLIASSQGNDTFAVFERASPHDFVLSFSIVDGEEIDGVTETDGIDVTTADLGGKFPSGVFVAQDDDNDDDNQNHKLVAWDVIEGQIQETGYAERSAATPHLSLDPDD